MKFILLLLLVGLIFSCNNSEIDPDDSTVIVTIGSDNITQNDLQNELKKLSLKQKSIYTSSPEKLNTFLQTHINEKVLYNEGLKRGIRDREEIQKDLNNYETKLISKTLGKEILEEIDLNQDEIRAYYDQNRNNYERIDISKIAIRIDDNEAHSEDAALAKAELVSKRAKEGENFEKLAEELSDDPITRKRGGKVGYIKRGRFPEDLDNVVFSLKEGDITKPFEVDGGYLIIKVNKEADFPPYAQLENNIRSELINERLLEYINNLRVKWDVQVYEDRIEEISNSEPNK